MKKIFTIGLVLIFLLSAVSCNFDKADPNENGASSIENEAETPKATDDPSESAPDPENTDKKEDETNTALDTRLLSLFSLSEYNSYFEENADSIPEHFITYDMISHLGEFDAFMCSERRFNIQYRAYTYQIRSGIAGGQDSGRTTLTIMHDQKQSDQMGNAAVIFDNSNENLLTCPGEATGIYTLNGIQYVYRNGNLWCVMWKSNGVSFMYSRDGGNTFVDNDVKTDTEFLSKLFTKSGAAEAVKLFDEMINEAK